MIKNNMHVCGGCSSGCSSSRIFSPNNVDVAEGNIGELVNETIGEEGMTTKQNECESKNESPSVEKQAVVVNCYKEIMLLRNYSFGKRVLLNIIKSNMNSNGMNTLTVDQIAEVLGETNDSIFGHLRRLSIDGFIEMDRKNKTTPAKFIVAKELLKKDLVSISSVVNMGFFRRLVFLITNK